MSTLRVLMYHKIDAIHSDFLCVTSGDLERQLIYIKDNYNVIRLSELNEHLKTGKALPANALLITFDDGYVNNFNLAYPLFKQYQIPFNIFLISEFIGKQMSHDGELQDFLSEEQCLKMQDWAEFAYHSANHENILDIPASERESSIMKCIEGLQQTQIPLQNFWAFTYGSSPRKQKQEMTTLESTFQKLGIVGSFRIGNRINRIPLKNRFLIERIDIRGEESFLKFKIKVKFGKNPLLSIL